MYVNTPIFCYCLLLPNKTLIKKCFSNLIKILQPLSYKFIQIKSPFKTSVRQVEFQRKSSVIIKGDRSSRYDDRSKMSLPLLSCEYWMFVKENHGRKKDKVLSRYKHPVLNRNVYSDKHSLFHKPVTRQLAASFYTVAPPTHLNRHTLN